MLKKILLLLFSITINASLKSQTIINTIWGQEIINDPLIETLIKHPLMQRLQHIDQSGPHLYFGILPKFNRYEHSVGVLALLVRAQRSQKECVAGLLHDSSHTVFSHLADVLFKKNNTSTHYHESTHSYQDDIHLEYLQKHTIDDVVNHYGISLEDLNPDKEEYKALEQPLPTMCADRIQYNIHTGVVLNLISTDQARDIINDLIFDGTQWYFTNPQYAKTFALLSVHFTQYLWGAPYNAAFYHYFAQVLRHAVTLNLISYDDIHYSTDKTVFNILEQSKDPFIEAIFTKCNNIYQNFTTVTYGQGDINIKPKYRGINPLVMIDNQLFKLSEIDIDFNNRFNEVQEWCKKGYGIVLTN